MVTALFAGTTILFTLISLLLPNVYYGFGFLFASMIFVVTSIMRLDYFTKRLPYYILSVQPLVAEDKSGKFARLKEFLDDKLVRMWEKNEKKN